MPQVRRRRTKGHGHSSKKNEQELLGSPPRRLPIQPRAHRDLPEFLQPEPPTRTPEHDQFMVTHAFRSEIEDYPTYQYRINASNSQFGVPSFPNLWNPQVIQLQIEEKRDKAGIIIISKPPLTRNPAKRSDFAAINQNNDPNNTKAKRIDIMKQEEFDVARADVVGHLDHTAQPGFLAKVYSDVVSSGTLSANSLPNNSKARVNTGPFNQRQESQFQRRGRQRYQNRHLHRSPIARTHDNPSRIRRGPEQSMQDEHNESQLQDFLDRLQYCREERSALLQHVTNLESAWNYQDFRLQRDIDHWRRNVVQHSISGPSVEEPNFWRQGHMNAEDLSEQRMVRSPVQNVEGSDIINRNDTIVPGPQRNANKVDQTEDYQRKEIFNRDDNMRSPRSGALPIEKP